MSKANVSNTVLVVAGTTLAIAGATLACHSLWNKRKKKEQKRQLSRDEINNASISTIALQGIKLKPPFPTAVREMLSKCRLTYMSTVDTEVGSSHLSLMRFTYIHDPDDGEVIIMSTNKKTKKFDMLQRQRGVALLVHDFHQDGGGGVYSITLNGECRIVSDKSREDHYRKAHLKHNPDYPQFIVGEDIAILCVDVTSARICNINDQVVKWDIADSSECQP